MARGRPFARVCKLHWTSRFRFVQSARRGSKRTAEVLSIGDGLGAGEPALLFVAVDGDVLQRFRQWIGWERERGGLPLARVSGRSFADALEAGGRRARFRGHERRAHLAFV